MSLQEDLGRLTYVKGTLQKAADALGAGQSHIRDAQVLMERHLGPDLSKAMRGGLLHAEQYSIKAHGLVAAIQTKTEELIRDVRAAIEGGGS